MLTLLDVFEKLASEYLPVINFLLELSDCLFLLPVKLFKVFYILLELNQILLLLLAIGIDNIWIHAAPEILVFFFQ